MPKAKKLSSGSWRCRVYVRTDKIVQPDGTIKEKKIMKSFTVKDPSPEGRKKCERLAAEWSADHEHESICDMTFGEGIDAYIAARESVFSPCTVKDYKSIRRNHLQGLMNKKISDITQDDIQREVNSMSQNRSPKTVRNAHALLTAVMSVYRPDFAIKTNLPKRVRPDIYVPSDNDISRLIAGAAGTDLELPILLAAFGPMRRGEIAALRSENINGNIVHVCENMVIDGSGGWKIKSPKSYAGDRFIDYPDFVADKWKGIDGRITELNPNSITDRFNRLLHRLGLPHFRFHDLRHYAASIQHAIGIPDVYIMERGGWGNDGTLKSVYRHAMEDKYDAMNRRANDYFSEHFSGKVDTKVDTK